MLINSAALMYVVVETEKTQHFYADELVEWVPDMDHAPAGVRAVENRLAKGILPKDDSLILGLFAQAVISVSRKTDANGVFLYFQNKAHYHSVYRLAVDYGFNKEADYVGFSSLMERLNLTELGKVSYNSDSVRKANELLYASPFCTWSAAAYREKNMSTNQGWFSVRFQLAQDIKLMFEFGLAIHHITLK